jgi:3-methylcrotonyl-CoA carboxylase alpha subunit
MSWIEVEIQGRKIRVAIVRAGEGVWAGWPGQARYLGPERAISQGSGAVEREVRAPMTGRVVSVAARPGARVVAAEVLVILEAMKMEYRLVAPRDGTIESVGCKEGERVDLGHVLVTLAP